MNEATKKEIEERRRRRLLALKNMPANLAMSIMEFEMYSTIRESEELSRDTKTCIN